jgi:hypothetical protein
MKHQWKEDWSLLYYLIGSAAYAIIWVDIAFGNGRIIERIMRHGGIFFSTDDLLRYPVGWLMFVSVLIMLYLLIKQN